MVVSAAPCGSTQITQICATRATAATLLSAEVCLADQPGSQEIIGRALDAGIWRERGAGIPR